MRTRRSTVGHVGICVSECRVAALPAVLVNHYEFDGITWHTGLRHLGGDTSSPRTPQLQSCARSEPCPVVPCRAPWLHHAKLDSGLRNFLLGDVAVILVFRPDVSARIASVELDWQPGWTFE
jgi:hypothetical protein